MSQTSQSASLLELPGTVRVGEPNRVSVPDPTFRVRAPLAGGAVKDATTANSGFFYVPNFITEEEEAYLIEHILRAPQPKWKVLQARRLQYWGGALTGKGKNVLLPDPQGLPSFLASYPDLITRLAQCGAFEGTRHAKPNHCLVNEYTPGQGIMPHDDGPAYEPVTATISLGNHAFLDIYEWIDDASLEAAGATPDPSSANRTDTGATPHRARGARAPEPTFTLLQEPRSLLVTRGSAYHDWLHGIADRKEDPPECLARVANVASIADIKLRTLVEKAQQAYPDLVPQLKSGPKLHSEGPTKLDSTLKPLPRNTRYSLTFRDVAKVSNALGGLAARKLGIV